MASTTSETESFLTTSPDSGERVSPMRANNMRRWSITSVRVIPCFVVHLGASLFNGYGGREGHRFGPHQASRVVQKLPCVTAQAFHVPPLPFRVKNVSKAKLLFPEPLSPVTTVSFSFGMVTWTSFKL